MVAEGTSPPRRALARRGFLEVLALAPVAAALGGCAGARAAAAAAPPAPPERAGRVPWVDEAAALDAIRDAIVPEDAEPALVFRAAAARPGEPR
jgi:hypothetical protein